MEADMRVLALALAVLAGGTAAAQVQGPAQALPAAVPDRLAADLAAAPDRVVAAASRIVHGYGDGRRMTAADVDRAIAVERAAARGREAGRMLAADLDADGVVTAVEAAAAGAALSAGARARMMRMVDAADANRDGNVVPAELSAAADAAALRAVPEAAAARDRALLALDLDGDGGVTLDEIRQAAALAAAAAPVAADDA
jgi:hypothetical protein